MTALSASTCFNINIIKATGFVATLKHDRVIRKKNSRWAYNCYRGFRGPWERSSEDTGHTHRHWRQSVRPGSSESKAYLDVGGVALARLPVDVQAELAADLADLRSAMGKVDPRRLALLPLVHVGRQVVQQI